MPRSVRVLSAIADRLADRAYGAPTSPVRYFWPALFARNLFFLIIILLHGFRRLAPPY